MASIKEISLPHGTIPTQMFGNVNLQSAVMYVNENFAAVKEGVNDAVVATNEAIAEKADGDHDHDDAYSALGHTHSQSEVIGLSSALDGKADLNHEHSQYLSSLPAHYHDVTGIQGLGEQLQAKAEKTHSHTMAQVENLSTELGVKASTAYVDQQVNAVGTSIKVIADQEIIDCGAAKEGTGGAASTDVPKDATIAPSDETVAQKNARVGTANRWARADHKHVFETETDAQQISKLKRDGNGTDGAADFGTETIVPRIDHSHPLNFPNDKPVGEISQDGMGEGGSAAFGDTNYYADLGHSHPLNVSSETPSDVVKSTGSASSGDSEYYARQDHVHKMPELDADDIKYSSTTVGEEIDELAAEVIDHEERITALESAPAPSAPVTSVNTKTGAVVLDAEDVGALSDDDIGDSVQAHSGKLDGLESQLTSDGDVPLSAIDGSISGHSGSCLLYVNGSGEVGHVGDGSGGNKVFELVENLKSSTANKIITDTDIGNGLEADSTLHNLQVKCAEDGGIVADSDGLSVSSDVVLFDSSSPPSSPSIVSMNASGVLSAECEVPTSAPTTNKVLTVKANGTLMSWEDGMTMGTQTSPNWLRGANISTDSANQDNLNPQGAKDTVCALRSSWTRGDTDQQGNRVGTKLSVCTGITQYSPLSTFYAAHFATLSFDENGMLCKCETAQSWFKTVK